MTPSDSSDSGNLPDLNRHLSSPMLNLILKMKLNGIRFAQDRHAIRARYLNR
jgi:hypothetical protein